MHGEPDKCCASLVKELPATGPLRAETRLQCAGEQVSLPMRSYQRSGQEQGAQHHSSQHVSTRPCSSYTACLFPSAGTGAMAQQPRAG